MESLNRYSRQLLFKPIGEEGQRKLLNSKVVIVGMGALGTVIANHLVRSGVGYVRMIDRDLVELSNLQRQSLYDEEDAAENLPKVIAAERKLKKVNSTVKVEAVIADLHLGNAEELLSGFDVIVDGTDNFSTRYLINDVAFKLGIPWVHGGAVSSRGMYAVFIPGKTPCYRCLFPQVPSGLGETCDTVGVLSPLTDIIGSFESVETLKLLVGADHNPNLEQVDIWFASSLQMDISDGHNPECPTCVHQQFEFLDRSSEVQTSYAILCGRDTVQINPKHLAQFDLAQLAKQLKDAGTVKKNSFLLRFTPNDSVSMVFFKDGRVLVHGVEDIVEARKYYSQYVGS
ncbi:ThiF family adenylyltransferase [Mesobacillus maritimus]|uniref:ThiF family adenylyltransferase n=1 Tax=Mesobacillus maritimus TaxID=1643336 RepID=UPI00203AD5E3|nr:ThiF family adenylyltransferase [Mesobacillus maritimus]MCM3585100.1 ThiF family adenylyltransferase [Mesobacillus maritimus]MCM3670322.1 ThiF family adenylyltransferase [Mesobacillus maritimus]